MSWYKVKRDPADDAFSEWIRRRDKCCQKCGQAGYGDKGITGLDASHFWGRGKENTRFDPLNVDAMCRNCHKWLGEHKTEYEAWKLNQIGQTQYDLLELRSNTYRKKERKLEAIFWKRRLRQDYNV